jgi:hypothetical protein
LAGPGDAGGGIDDKQRAAQIRAPKPGAVGLAYAFQLGGCGGAIAILRRGGRGEAGDDGKDQSAQAPQST